MTISVPAGFKHLHTTRQGTHWFIRSNGPHMEADYLMVQDTESLLDRNVAMANQNDGWSVEGASKADKLLRRMASVPWGLIAKWKNEEGIDYFNPDHQDAVNAKLDSREYWKLRTADYRIGRQLAQV